MIPSIATGPAQTAIVRVMRDGHSHKTGDLIQAIYGKKRPKKTADEIVRHTIVVLRRKGYAIRSIKRGRWIMEAMPVVTIKKIKQPINQGTALSTLQIISEVCKEMLVTIDEVQGPSRKRHIVRARWEAIDRMRQRGLSLNKIGLALGKRDHTTILHALRQIKLKKSLAS